jgi:hypothetical protein
LTPHVTTGVSSSALMTTSSSYTASASDAMDPPPRLRAIEGLALRHERRPSMYVKVVSSGLT